MRKKIDLFCYKHPNFGIRNLMRYIVIASAVIWILQFIMPGIVDYLAFSPSYILQGQVWRLISFIFIPVSTNFLAFIAFYFYYMVGNILEAKWGTGRFTIYFFSGVLFTIVYGFLIYFLTGVSYPVRADYIYLSMFFSFAALFPDMQVLLFFILPIRIKWLALVNAALFLWGIVMTRFPFNLLPVVAVLNFFLFCGGDLFDKLRGWIKGRQSRVKTVDFRKESERIRREQQSNLYTHKCAVCGRTDADHPELEFRYCSKCAGYHCFCQDHINSHIHFTE